MHPQTLCAAPCRSKNTAWSTRVLKRTLAQRGVTVVVIRKDFVGSGGAISFQAIAASSRMPMPVRCSIRRLVFGIYVVGLVAKWLEEQGGLSAIEQRNRDKAKLLYDVIDSSDFYRGHALPNSRSIMNVTFNLPSDELQASFVEEAAKQSLCNLKGHRSVGGIRASIYNAMPVEGVETLRDFMVDFAARNQ